MNGRIPQRADSMGKYNLLDIEDKKGDSIAYLARSGGRVHGDNFTVFPQIVPINNKYTFYFPLDGICTLAKQGNSTASVMFKTLCARQTLNIRHTKNETSIFHRGIKIGHCPEYIHHLLWLNPNAKFQLTVEKVNHKEERYAYRAIAVLVIESKSPLYDHHDFQPINTMPV